MGQTVCHDQRFTLGHRAPRRNGRFRNDHRGTRREGVVKSPSRWHTLAVARVPGLKMDAVRFTQAGSPVVRAVTDAVIAPGRALRDALGIEVTERPVHRIGQGKWAVEIVNEDALAFWSSDAQAAAIDAWPHDAELAAVDDCVLVRVPG